MNRPEPRPLPKPLRVLCLFVAALLVCSLGVIVANHQPSTAGDDHGSAIDRAAERCHDPRVQPLQQATL